MRRPKTGTITVALTVIAAGVALLLQQFGRWHWDLLKYAGPAVLIVLGLEIIWMRLRHDDGAVRYSGLSFVLAALAIFVSLGYTGVVAFVPHVFGPVYTLPVEGELPVTAQIRRLEVELPVGAVSLRGTTDARVRYSGSLPFPGGSYERARADQHRYWTAEQIGDTLVLRLDRGGEWGRTFLAGRPYLNVDVPPGLDVSVRTRNSRIDAERLETESLTLRTSNSSVVVAEATGPLTVTTSNASVRVRDIAGAVDVVTSNAAVKVQDVAGSLRVSTSNSAITAESAVGGDWTLDTSNSSVTVVVPAGTDAVFQASTSNSRIGGNVPWNLTRRETEGSARIGAGTHRVTLSTSNAAIRVNEGR